MTDRHELHAYDYVNSPYDLVRAALLSDPMAVLRHADESSNVELHVNAGPIQLGAEVVIQILSITAEPAPGERPLTVLELAWKAARRPAWFPTMRATLMFYPLTAQETQLDFCGAYDPPLGIIGDAIDAAGMHRIAKDSIQSFVTEVAKYLRDTLATAVRSAS